MSTAILYLAIVAIWAGFLVPRLLRRSQQRSAATVIDETVAGPADLAGQDADPEVVAVGGAGLGEGPAYYAAPYEGPVTGSPAVPPDRDDEGVEYDFPDHVDTEEISIPRSFLGRPLWTEQAGWRAAGSRSGDGGPGGPGGPGRPLVTRAAALRARRRSLTLLVTLLLVTAGLAAQGAVPGWVLVPPLGVLGLFLLVLREAAKCDAELAEKRAAAHAAELARQARAARQRAREQARQAAAAAQHEAEVIDISGRVG
ncbi:MAG TPA: hypothetical protein VF204_12010, partial [Streptosporangiaceae bacterium]